MKSVIEDIEHFCGDLGVTVVHVPNSQEKYELKIKPKRCVVHFDEFSREFKTRCESCEVLDC